MKRSFGDKSIAKFNLATRGGWEVSRKGAKGAQSGGPEMNRCMWTCTLPGTPPGYAETGA